VIFENRNTENVWEITLSSVERIANIMIQSLFIFCDGISKNLDLGVYYLAERAQCFEFTNE